MKKITLLAMGLIMALRMSAEITSTEVSSLFTNTNFETGSTNGWVVAGRSAQIANTAANFGYQGSCFMEAWTQESENLADFDWSQTSSVPNGYYMVTVLAHAIKQDGTNTTPQGVVVYAADKELKVTSTSVAEYSIFVKVTDGELTIGFRGVGCNVNWVACDNFRIREYTGTTNANLDVLESWLLQEEILSAYINLEKKIDQVNDFIRKNGSNGALDSTLALATERYCNYIMNAPAASAVETELHAALCSYLETTAISGEIDVTSLFVTNPSLNNSYEGWVPSSRPTFNYGVAEFFDCDFSIYQHLSGLPKGLYVISVQGFYRESANDGGTRHIYGEEEITANLFANKVSIPLKSLYEEYLRDEMEADYYLKNGYLDNLVATSEAFNRGYYKGNRLEVYVTDGNLTFGLSNLGHKNSSWCAFRDFELAYHGAQYSGPLSFTITSEKTVEVSGCDMDYSGHVDIPLQIDHYGVRYKVTGIGDYAFRSCEFITSITIPEGVTSIGESAFYGCSSLTAVHISSLEAWCNIDFSSYDANPLYYAKNLYLNGELVTELAIPNSVTAIKNHAFEGCSSLTSITIPESVTSIGSSAFYNCRSLTSITLPEGVTSIGSSAFYNCSSLTSITIPESVTSIEDYAFDGCTSLKEVIIEDGSTTLSLGYNDYSSYSYSAGEGLFYDCPLESAYLGRNLSYSSGQSYGYSPFFNKTKLTDLTIGSSVTSIGSSAFHGCSSLTSITIPESVTFIGDDAFYGCSNLTSITIPEDVTSIGDKAFSWCSSLTSITIPESVTSIGSYAFYNCSSLTSITIPESVTSIGESAFCYCSSLTAVHISSLEAWCNIDFSSSDANPLYYAKNLYLNGELVTELAIPNSVTAIKNHAFEGCSSLTSITIPEDVTSIGDKAFSWCSSLTSITIPESVTSIGNYAFDNCTSLKEVVFEDGNTTLSLGHNNYSSSGTGQGLFYDCPLESVYLGRNLSYSSDQSYGYSPFYNKTKLTDLTIGSSVTSIGNQAFSGCSSLTSITIPESVTSIGIYAFDNCTSLKEIVFEDGNTTLSLGYNNYYNSGLFYDCPLESAYLGRNLSYSSGSSYGYSPFYNKTKLTDLTIGSSVTFIGDDAFYGCSDLTSITIPESVTSIGNYAFDNCTSLKEIVFEDGSTTLSLGYNSYYNSGTGQGLFYDCPLESAYLGRNLSYSSGSSYGYSPFCNKTKLTDLTIGSSVTSIGNQAFSGCSSLTSITIPESVTSIGSYTFSDCSSLTEVHVSSIEAWCNIDFEGYSSNPLNYAHKLYLNGELVTELVIPESVTSIGSYTFSDCSSLTSITIPESVTSIGSYAFYNCSSLTSIIIPESVTSIGNQAFSGCSCLVSLTIGTNVDSYGSDVFAGCTSVEELMVKGSVMPMVPSDKFTTIRMFSPGPLDTEEFDAKVYRTATLYVPEGSLARYQMADVWKKFWYIEEFDPNEEIEVTLDRTTVTMTEGDVITLVATIIPQYIKDKTVAWTTSDAAIATVDNGVVTAVAEGTATITAKAGDKEATCVVTVSIPTGVGQLTMDNGQWTIYDLTGRKVENPAKGIYIVGGKKVVLQ